MSLDTLLEAAKFVESSSRGSSKDDSAIARVHSPSVHTERRRAISECEPLERRRRPGGAGTRETHNKLEKNRRAHLKECFDILKKEVPSLEDKKTSNLNILRSALKHIQTLKKRERDFEAERDLLKVSNSTSKQRLLALKNELILQQELFKASSQGGNNSKACQLLNETTSVQTEVKVKSEEKLASPVSVATQTSFTSGEESDVDGTKVNIEGVTNGKVEHSNVEKHEKEASEDDEDEDVDVEGEITDDNIEDVDASAAVKAEVVKLPEPVGPCGKVSSSKRKAAAGDDGNKLEAKKTNIKCCARVSC
nr:max dimerization protein 3-like [Pocillopora verrucosa]